MRAQLAQKPVGGLRRWVWKERSKDKAELRGSGFILEMMVGGGERERDNGTTHLLLSEDKWKRMTHTGVKKKEQVSDRALLTGIRREEVKSASTSGLKILRMQAEVLA